MRSTMSSPIGKEVSTEIEENGYASKSSSTSGRKAGTGSVGRWTFRVPRKAAAGHECRALGCVGDRLREPIEKLIELGGCVEIYGLCEVVLWTMVADLVPLTVAALRVSVGVIAEDEANGGYSNAQKGIMVSAAEQTALGLAVGA